jgi:hypothetical protein
MTHKTVEQILCVLVTCMLFETPRSAAVLVKMNTKTSGCEDGRCWL